jgi:predicted nucleic acid-binding protein
VPFLQLAVTGQAQRLVSGDKDVLVLAQVFYLATGCRIITMSALLSEIAAGELAPG